AINVSLPLCLRPWALPVLVALSLPPAKKAKPAKKNAPAGKKAKPWSKLKARRQARDKRRLRKTPATHARQMIAVLLHWFPERKFILLGDWGFASHDLALFCLRHRDRLTLIARTRSDMRLYAAAPPAKPAGSGRRQRKGVRLPSPAQSVAASAVICVGMATASATWNCLAPAGTGIAAGATARRAWSRCDGCAPTIPRTNATITFTAPIQR